MIVNLRLRDPKRAFLLAAIPRVSRVLAGLYGAELARVFILLHLCQAGLDSAPCRVLRAVLFYKHTRLAHVDRCGVIGAGRAALRYNIGNAWWIDRIGASPLCYGWGLAVSVIAIGALSRGVNFWPSLGLSLAIVAGAGAFFVSHHYFQIPW